MKHLLTIISCLLVLNLTAQEVVVEYPYNPDFENDGNVGVEDLMQLLGAFGNSFNVEQIMLDGLTLDEWAELVNEINFSQQQVLDSLVSNTAQEVDSIWLELSGDTLRLMPANSWVILETGSLDENVEFTVSEFSEEAVLPESCVNWIFRDENAPEVHKVAGILDGWVYYMTPQFQLVKITGNSEWQYVTQNIFGEFTSLFESTVYSNESWAPGTSWYMSISNNHLVSFGGDVGGGGNGSTNKIFSINVETTSANYLQTDDAFVINAATQYNSSNTTESRTQFQYPWLLPYQNHASEIDKIIVNLNLQDDYVLPYTGTNLLQLANNLLLGSHNEIGCWIYDLETFMEIPLGEENGALVARNDTIVRGTTIYSNSAEAYEIESFIYPTLQPISAFEISRLSGGTSSPFQISMNNDEFILQTGTFKVGSDIVKVNHKRGFLNSVFNSTEIPNCALINYMDGKNGVEYYGEYNLSIGVKHALGIEHAWITYSQ